MLAIRLVRSIWSVGTRSGCDRFRFVEWNVVRSVGSKRGRDLYFIGRSRSESGPCLRQKGLVFDRLVGQGMYGMVGTRQLNLESGM